jgi:hypothetical protein
MTKNFEGTLMAMNFEELDAETRKHMLSEFEREEASGNPYRGKGLSDTGRAAFSNLMREAIAKGTEETLAAALAKPQFWNPTETYTRKGIEHTRTVNVAQAAERLALTEFNTWYVRGLSKRLTTEGVTQCQVYRAAPPKWEPAECSRHENQICSVKQVYEGHRANYWPEPGNPAAFSIPAGPNCHHTIRRVPIKNS